MNYVLQNILIDVAVNYCVIYSILKTTEGFELYKSYLKKDKVNYIKETPKLMNQYSNFNKDIIKDTKFKEYIRNFYETLDKQFSKEELIILRNNLTSLQIKKKSVGLVQLIASAKAFYSSFSNQIVIYSNKDISDSIYHELFHMASSVVDNKEIHSGFRQNVCLGKGNMGIGINEGYTQLLTERYFPIKRSCYPLEKHLVSNLEEIVGLKEMEKLYLQANLKRLVDTLHSYSSDSDIITFINKMDFLIHRFDSTFPFKDKMVENSLKCINSFLIKSYAKKEEQALDKERFSADDYRYHLINYIMSLGNNIQQDRKKYQVFSPDEMDSLLTSVHLDSISNDQKEIIKRNRIKI